MNRNTILIVDDEEGIRLVVSRLLDEGGYRVLTAASAAEGLRIATAEAPDLVLSDIMMPGESGFTLCAKLKANPSTKDIPVVFLSVMDEEQRGLDVGATAFLTKPFEEADLLKTIADVLQPTDLLAMLQLALNKLRDGDLTAGMRDLERVVETDSKSALAVWAQYYYAIAQVKQAQPQMAIQTLLRALRVDPTFWRAHNRLSMLHASANDRTRAIKHLERSLQLNPNQPDTVQQLNTLVSGG